jgi:hypothetical protein
MRILYLGCHSINEYEDIKLFSSLGHEVVAMGAYNNPAHPGSDARPALPDIYFNPKMAKVAATLKWDYWTTSVIPDELLNWCDAIYILGIQVWLPYNWDRIKNKHVIFRSIGQSVQGTEDILRKYRPEGLKVVRYSPFEERIPGYVGGDALIRFYKDEDEYKGWTGEKKQVITVAQDMKKREDALKYSVFEKCTHGFPRKLYGFSNQNETEVGGQAMSYEELKQVLRENRAFFYTCTFPAPYTMGFIEAWMTGLPVVAIGPALAGWPWIEVPSLISNGVNGFTSDSVDVLRSYVSMLLQDHELAKRLSVEGRKKAIELFGKESIKAQWKAFFESL